MRSLSNRTKGIICILAAAFGFALMTAFVRAAGDVPVMQKSFFRNLVAMFIASIALVRSGIGFKIEKSYRLDIFFRCLFGTSGVIANFYAIGKLGIADANMLNKLAPFFAIVLSIPLLKEVPSKVDAISTLIAFIGENDERQYLYPEEFHNGFLEHTRSKLFTFWRDDNRDGTRHKTVTKIPQAVNDINIIAVEKDIGPQHTKTRFSKLVHGKAIEIEGAFLTLSRIDFGQHT